MKTLIVYFSWSGNTDTLVKQVNQSFNFDVSRVERKQPYSSDYNTCAYVEAKAEWQNHTHPQIVDLDVDWDNYNRILLFFPIWWYTIPMPIATFIENLNGYSGEIIIFENSYTNDPQYAHNSLADLQLVNKKLNIKQGLLNKSVAEHIKFIEDLK